MNTNQPQGERGCGGIAMCTCTCMSVCLCEEGVVD